VRFFSTDDGQRNKLKKPNKRNEPVVGVLAFHGDVAEHEEVLRSMGIGSLQVKSVADLEKVDRLIIPGGESTVIAAFLNESGVGDVIRKRAKKGTLPIYGTCAGAIILAKRVKGKNAPATLNVINISIERNAYGSQRDSFETTIAVQGVAGTLPVAFIRAPKITKVGRKVEILASHNGNPVLVRQGKLLAGTFHPEVRGSQAIHKLFLAM
jgi:5'-phosphate synthase pdxT subunit